MSPRDNEAPPAHGLPATPAADVAAAAARAGGAVLLARWHADDLQVAYKDARANLVTVADRESQQAVTDTILAAFPDDAIDGEEGTAGNPAAGSVWYVDPLDGTTNYAHGLPFFCVSVAQRFHGRTVAGAVYDPVRDEMFAAAVGAGAGVNGQPLRVSAVTRLDRALVVAQAQSVDEDEIRAYAALAERLMRVTGGVRSLGSPALTLCAIAAGRLDAYCEYAMDAWDIAAGQLILQEAGGTLTLFDGRPHVTADRADVVASNGAIHAELITALKGLAVMTDYQYPATLPVTTTGGWARPGWWDILADAEKEGRFGPADRQELLDDYCQLAIRDQEAAGLDTLTDGEHRRGGWIEGITGKMAGLRAAPIAAQARRDRLGHAPRLRGARAAGPGRVDLGLRQRV